MLNFAQNLSHMRRRMRSGTYLKLSYWATHHRGHHENHHLGETFFLLFKIFNEKYVKKWTNIGIFVTIHG